MKFPSPPRPILARFLSTWVKPCGQETIFTVKNSLAGEVVPLVLTNGKAPLTWYACGPTVYDSAHVGHARTYVSQDIIRRIFSLFNLRHTYVLGMTDIDDKIVNRAKERSIHWKDLALGYEKEFLEDLALLDVKRPSVVTRVSEYIPEIIAFVEKIQAKGEAYATEEGSVYFDTCQFQLSHTYGKLQPLRQNNSSPEGIPAGETARGKKHPKDFALWKAAPKTEPGWSSPWGHGRPGWHIECSAMSSAVFGSHLDLHTGGIDLQFPHHDNEIAQCESHHSTDNWCNYFLHTGHLHIEGHKMSKSLKNFTTIRDFLKSNTSRQFRVFCLLHRYHASVDFGTRQLQEAISVDKRLADFHANITSALSSAPVEQVSARWSPAESDFYKWVRIQEEGILLALVSDFDTPLALTMLLELISRTYAHLGSVQSPPSPLLLEALLDLFIKLTEGAFGLNYQAEGSAAGSSKLTRDLIQEFVDFRWSVRTAALGTGENTKGELLRLCDEVRNSRFPALGIALKDTKRESTWSFNDPAKWEE